MTLRFVWSEVVMNWVVLISEIVVSDDTGPSNTPDMFLPRMHKSGHDDAPLLGSC